MRLAFIGGCGHHYLRRALSDAEFTVSRPVPVAGDGSDDARARAFAASLGDVRWFDEPIEMLDIVRPAIVSIGAVYGRNGDFVAAALERDIRVVSDKPIAASWDVLRRIQALTAGPEGIGRVVLTEFHFRSLPEFRAARAAVLEGGIGDVVLATAQKSYRFGERPAWYADRTLYGGTMLWVASHGIDAIRFVTGRSLACVYATAGNLSQPGYGALEDHTVSVYRLAGGGTGVVHADFLRPVQAGGHGDDRLRLAGTRGVLEVRDGRCLLTTHTCPETDITDRCPVQPLHRELLATAWGGGTDLYSTAASLEMAELLLRSRDLADLHSEETGAI